VQRSPHPPYLPANPLPVIEGFVLALAVVASAALVGYVAWYAGSGYDFSDEGHYLNWIANPWGNRASVSHFSFFYHPLYRLTGGDVALLRRANLLLTLGLGWVFCEVLLRKVGPGPGGSARNLPRTSLAIVLSTGTLACLHTAWLPTPSYDSLTLQALLVAGTGILLAQPRGTRQGALGWMLIGVSLWMAFMAKPTSAVALGAVVLLYLSLSRKANLRMLALSTLVAGILGLFTAWVVDGSVGDFAVRLVNGAEDSRLLQGGHTLGEAWRLDDFSLNNGEKRTLAGAAFLVFLSSSLCFSSQPARRLAGIALPLLFSSAGLLVTGSAIFRELQPESFQGLQYWAVPLGVLPTVLLLMARRKSFLRAISPDHWALAICLLIFPWTYAFGTNSNYWIAESRAAIFWVLAAVVLLGSLREDPLGWRVFLPAATAAQLCTSLLLVVAMEHPYRQAQPLRRQMDILHFTGSGSELLVSREFAQYVEKLRQLAQSSGFQAGMPVLDLTGHYPGALYVLGAKSVGRSWMIGGYPGSDAMARATLDRTPPDQLRDAWILVEPEGPRKLSPDILKPYGLDLDKDYVAVGMVDSPIGEYPKSYRQKLLKPAR
jgi:hypothetical protein